MVLVHCTQFGLRCLQKCPNPVMFGEMLDPVAVVTLELGRGDGLEPGLAVGEGGAGGLAFEQLAVELEDEEGAGGGFDGPEGATWGMPWPRKPLTRPTYSAVRVWLPVMAVCRLKL
jgi:hypothetical protein